jgi:alpha-galactosidase
MSSSLNLLLVLALSVKSSISTNPGCVPNCIGSTPALNARSWNSVRDAINQSFVISQINGLISPLSTGGTLSSFGYSSYGIDDGWEACGSGINGSFHDFDGYPMINKELFPNMEQLVAYGTANNISLGWYMNCCGCPAEHKLSSPHYQQDAFATAALGFSGLKIDGCGNEPNSTAWAEALTLATQAGLGPSDGIVLENCNDDTPFRPEINPDGSINCPYNFFRTSIDGSPSFRSTIWNVYQTLPYIKVSSPGCFAYSDMLTIGVPAVGYGGDSFMTNCNGTRLTEAESRAQFAAFALLSSPLVLGFDVGNETERLLWGGIVTHANTLAINALWDGEAGRLVAQSSTMWTGPVFVGGVCELLQTYTMPNWMVIGKRLEHNPTDGTTTKFAAVMIVGDYAGSVDFSAPLSAMGFAPGVSVSSVDGWTNADTGDITTSWEESGVVAPGGLYRIFTLKT